MFESWLMNVLNVLLPTIAVLLIFLSQRRLLHLVESLAISDQKLLLLEKHQKRVSVATALLAAWLVVQYLPLVT